MNLLNSRIRAIRDALNLPQTTFASKIGIRQSSLSALENGKTEKIDERTVKVICQEFNVSETWLRDGIGDMFVQTDDSLLSEIEHEFTLNKFTKAIVMEYIRMPDDLKNTFKSYLISAVEKFRNESAADTAGEEPKSNDKNS